MNENEIIELLTKVAGKLPPKYSLIGDDVVWLRTRPGNLILKSDMLVGHTDVPPGMTFRQVGRKAVAMCVSDFASKGVRPEAFMVSLGLPRTMSARDVHGLSSGFRDAMEEWGLHLLGGDTNEADDVVIDTILVGFAGRIVPRNGARPGDIVIVTGPFGTTSAGLKILLEGARAPARFRSKALHSVYWPSPRLGLGIALRDYLSSSMDSSDGLAVCLYSIAESSKVGIMTSGLPHEPGLERFASENGYRLEDLILYGGEEYEIVGTLAPDNLDEAQKAARAVKQRLHIIGQVTEHVGVRMTDGTLIEKKGWVHLS